MATAQTLINRAMRLLGVASAGETLSSEETADALVALNAMLDSWRNERLMVYAIRDETLTLINGTASYTIGTGGSLNTERPVKIVGAFVRDTDGNDYPVEMIEEAEYSAIDDKASTADYPSHAYYNPSMSTGTLYVYPIPTLGYTLHIQTWTPFASYASASETVTLPPGYEEAIPPNLSIRLGPEHGVVPADAVVAMAREAKANIKRVNSRPIKAYTELGTMFGPHRSNILTDQA